ncbi:MAG: Mu-like prophage major head subunit gpT family protein [Myxococcales bacterium]|nr:Mu-like prophage major head subunit gpT family protein [Myxococcales bacterium]
MAVGKTTSNLGMMYIGFKAAFKKAFDAADPEDWRRLATLVPSTTAAELYAWLGAFPSLREWIGDRVIKQLERHDYTIRNRTFESTIQVRVDDVEDDNFGLYGPLMADLGDQSRRWPAKLIFELLQQAITELCYDGQPFFSKTHPENGTTAANYNDADDAAPVYLFDTSRPLKPLIFQQRQAPQFAQQVRPDSDGVFMRDEYLYGVKARGNAGFGLWQQAYCTTATLNEENFNAAYDAMSQRVNDEGDLLGIRPTLMLVGASNRAKADKLINQQFWASGESNPLFHKVEVWSTPLLP